MKRCTLAIRFRACFRVLEFQDLGLRVWGLGSSISFVKSRLLRYHRGFIAYEAVHLGLNVLAPKAKNLRPAWCGLAARSGQNLPQCRTMCPNGVLSPQRPPSRCGTCAMPNNVPKPKARGQNCHNAQQCGQATSPSLPQSLCGLAARSHSAQQCAQTRCGLPPPTVARTPQCPTMVSAPSPQRPQSCWQPAGQNVPQCATICPTPCPQRPQSPCGLAAHSGQNVPQCPTICPNPVWAASSGRPQSRCGLAACSGQNVPLGSPQRPLSRCGMATRRTNHGAGWQAVAQCPTIFPNGCQTPITAQAGSSQWPERASMPDNLSKPCQNAQQSAQPRAPNDRNHGPQWPERARMPNNLPNAPQRRAGSGQNVPECPTICPTPTTAITVRAGAARSGQNVPPRPTICPNPGVGCQPPSTAITVRGGSPQWPERASMPNNLPNPVPPTTAITVRAGRPQWPERARMPNKFWPLPARRWGALGRLLGILARSGHCGLPARTVIAVVGGTGLGRLLGMLARSGHCGLPPRTVMAVDGGWHPTPGFGQIVGRGGTFWPLRAAPARTVIAVVGVGQIVGHSGTFWPLRAASPHRDCGRWGHAVGQIVGHFGHSGATAGYHPAP